MASPKKLCCINIHKIVLLWGINTIEEKYKERHYETISFMRRTYSCACITHTHEMCAKTLLIMVVTKAFLSSRTLNGNFYFNVCVYFQRLLSVEKSR